MSDPSNNHAADPSGQYPNVQWSGYPQNPQQAQQHPHSSPVVATSHAQYFGSSQLPASQTHHSFESGQWETPYQYQQPGNTTSAPLIGYYHQYGSNSAPFNGYHYYDQTVAYPPLPQQPWPSADQFPAPQVAGYPAASQHLDQGAKRKRTPDGHFAPDPAVSSLPLHDQEYLAMDANMKRSKIKHEYNDAPAMPVPAGMAAARSLATSAIKQEPNDAEPRPPLMERPLSIPGAYPESSGESEYGFSGRPLIKSEQPYPAEAYQQANTTTSAAPQTVSEDPPLCPEQAELVDLICSGRNVFYTGSAGCGKSTVLKAFTKKLRAMGKKVRILAPTGRAALQVNGQTFWTFAGWTPGHMKKPLDDLKAAVHGKYIYERIKKNTDVIVFDEISMVENHILERLNELMKQAWFNPHRERQPAFGGVQVIVTGDFCQLPPVKPFQYCMHCGKEMLQKEVYGRKTYTCPQHREEFLDEHKWAFSSKAWQECNFVHVNLKQIHRQNDQEFIRMLQKCRIGDPLSSVELNRLMDHPCQVHHATSLFATREQARELNEAKFKKLTGVNYSYWAYDTFNWNPKHLHLRSKGALNMNRGPPTTDECKPIKALDDHRFSDIVELKRGMLVVLLTNLDLGAGLCNGSQGIVSGFEAYHPNKMPKAMIGKKDDPSMKIMGDHASLKEQAMKAFIESKGAKFKQWPIVRFHNGEKRMIYAECSISELGDEQPYSLLARTQIPLAPAWAMTIHKSQSLTMDRVIVDLSRTFEEGQIYVALSRATGLSGLKINGDATALTEGLGGNREVQRFLREKFGALNALCS
ncbi:hypothetical protein PFICI_02775 [Pestalotiopsis fici W106-1]|uniref:ATP-dependent DNA helicase n=1 Tax=Pestalotiopsis fici (strain W106-1 / CGMCC3.15140) TaxID=1229662 RepID=W3XFF1_PESFW|nr:uncharacterized protein PFICI_02775 [Pestalotiopsis fici W106-1]ETS84750.1 hypothetical protein PFICI_02775 [Pestalotiopsis fici W106-1]